MKIIIFGNIVHCYFFTAAKEKAIEDDLYLDVSGSFSGAEDLSGSDFDL